jgi:hypothetical protein
MTFFVTYITPLIESIAPSTTFRDMFISVDDTLFGRVELLPPTRFADNLNSKKPSYV